MHPVAPIIGADRNNLPSNGLPIPRGDVELGAEVMEPVIAKLKKYDRSEVGEHNDIDLEECRSILQAAL